MAGKTKLKDVYENVEYFHVLKNKKTLLKLGEEINGKRKSEVQQIIGDQLGEGNFSFSLKHNNDPTPLRGTIRAFTSDKKPMPTSNNEEIAALAGLVDSINRKLESKAAGSFDVETMLKMQENVYKIQIKFFEQRIAQLEAENDRLKKQLEDDGGGNSSALDTILTLAQSFLIKPSPGG